MGRTNVRRKIVPEKRTPEKDINADLKEGLF